MYKNIAIGVLSFIVITLACLYVNSCRTNNTSLVSYGEKNVNLNNTIILIEAFEDYIYLRSKDGKFDLSFYYDKNGLWDTFWVRDQLSGKRFSFTLNDNGILSSYIYQDDRYLVKTNVGLDSDMPIWREEWFDKYHVIYRLQPDGEIKTCLELEPYTGP